MKQWRGVGTGQGKTNKVERAKQGRNVNKNRIGGAAKVGALASERECVWVSERESINKHIVINIGVFFFVCGSVYRQKFYPKIYFERRHVGQWRHSGTVVAFKPRKVTGSKPYNGHHCDSSYLETVNWLAETIDNEEERGLLKSYLDNVSISQNRHLHFCEKSADADLLFTTF